MKSLLVTSDRKKWYVAAAVLSFAAVGVVLVAISSAAINVASSEAEAGIIAGSAAIKADGTASGGNTVAFGTAPNGQAMVYGASGAGNPRTDDCTVNVQAGASVQAAITAAQAQAVICIKPADRSAEAITLDKAVVLRANGPVKVRSVTITGSNVTLDGFTIVGAASNGIALSGVNHTVINNLVTGRGINTGIACVGSCGNGHRIGNNTVTGIHNYGLYVSGGDNVTVERNNVYDLWMSTPNGDVDAMRLWGTNHKIRNNYFHDINEFKSARDSGGDTPHVDCWQSFQTASGLQLRNVLIENNYCVRISRQCMILSNHLNGNYDIRDITFRGNVCETYDSSVINLGSVAGITMENNFFLGGVKSQVLTVDYTREENPVGLPDRDIKLRNNIVIKGLTSADYFYRNSTRTLIDNTDNILAHNSVVKSNADAFQSNASAQYAATKASDFTFYRQLAQSLQTADQGSVPQSASFSLDIDGGPRVKGTAIDIGPFELR